MTYHRTFAWLPTRMTSGRFLWFAHYYIRPNSNGEGILLSHTEYLLESYESTPSY